MGQAVPGAHLPEGLLGRAVGVDLDKAHRVAAFGQHRPVWGQVVVVLPVVGHVEAGCPEPSAGGQLEDDRPEVLVQ
jgi:hypothetical protein